MPALNVVFVALLWQGAQAAQGSPLNKSHALRKVKQLLEDLSSQLVDDEKADEKQFVEFENLTKASIASANGTALKSSAEVAELKASIAAAEAFQAEKKSQLAAAADSLLKAQQDMELAKQQRLSEKETFVKSSQQLQQSAATINLALGSVQGMSGGMRRKDNFLLATKQIRTALKAGADELLTHNEHRFLARLLSAPRLDADSSQALQVRGSKDLDGPEGVEDLAATLKQVKKQTESEMAATRQAEQKSAEAFIQLTRSLQDEVNARQTALTEMKSAIASSEEASSKAKSDLVSTSRRLAVTNEQLVQLQLDLKDKTKDFRMRMESRKTEKNIILKATQILMKDAQTAQLGRSMEPMSFLQETQVSRFGSKVAKLMSKAASPGLAALLLETGKGKDVFVKVKEMIRQMLSKLREQQAQDSRRDEWCKKEMANTKVSEASKSNRAEKVKTRMLAINAELASLKSDIATGKEEIATMKEALAASKLQRQQEEQKAKSDLMMYKEDQRVLQEALLVLKQFYGEIPARRDSHGYAAKSEGSTVVSLLQVSVENFADLEEETRSAEKKAAGDFQEIESTSKIRLATFEKEVEYKTQRFTELESDLVRANSDLNSYKKEVKALQSYLGELGVSCSVKGLSFEERQEKREQQLDSLKEALRSLKGD